MSASFAKAWTTCYTSEGLQEIEIQVLLRKGLPRFDIIGLPQSMVREGKDRILASLHQVGIELPNQKVLVYLKPGDLTKEGSHLDLGIFHAILQVLGHIPHSEKKMFFWGELELNAQIRETEAILGHLLKAQEAQAEAVFLSKPQSALDEILPYLKSSVHFCKTAAELLEPKEAVTLSSAKRHTDVSWPPPTSSRWNKMRGSPDQFLFWSLASLGRWNILLNGSPGVGKSSWCHALRELQRPLCQNDWSERFKYAAPTETKNIGIKELSQRGFEAPHHTSSAASIVGGGHRQIYAGAISRAHRGILFLDELPEFQRNVLEALREPLEEKKLCIHRQGGKKIFPADIQLLAAMNPCRCGKYGSKKACVCSSTQFYTYQARLSEPLLERFHRVLWWSFKDIERPKEYDFTALGNRLVWAEKNKPQLSNIHLSHLKNARQQRLWIEMLITWCQFFGIDLANETESQNLKKFFERLEEKPNEMPL
jgi:magnesium chelatase family protein